MSESARSVFSHRQLGIGAALATLGGAGTALAPNTLASQIGEPWKFLAGFLVGICAGVGVALSVSGLLNYRRQAPSQVMPTALERMTENS